MISLIKEKDESIGTESQVGSTFTESLRKRRGTSPDSQEEAEHRPRLTDGLYGR